MTAFGERSSDEQRRLEEAAEWRLRLTHTPALEQSASYREWCADARNAEAREAVQRACAAIDAMEAAPRMLELRRQALARLPRQAPSRRLTRGWQLVATAAALLVAFGAYYYRGSTGQTAPNSTIYRTGIGERRIVALSDGSRISMDSRTVVEVSYRNDARTVTLDSGRSRFDVAHDPGRPFTVIAGQQRVLALGTSFDVERLDTTVLVTLVQGQVIIEGATALKSTVADAQQGIALTAGQELVASRNVRPAVVNTDLQAARAWEAGRLLFRDEPLGDAVARVNRYIAHPIEVDPSIAAIRVSGVFNAGDANSFVSAVTSYFPVDAIGTTHSILLKPRA